MGVNVFQQILYTKPGIQLDSAGGHSKLTSASQQGEGLRFWGLWEHIIKSQVLWIQALVLPPTSQASESSSVKWG